MFDKGVVTVRNLLPGIVVAAALVGCGQPFVPGLDGASGPLGAMADAPIVNLASVPIGVQLNVTGKYQSYDLSGSGEINALDSQHLALSGQVTAHVLFISETKQITFTLARSSDPTWPYVGTAVNVTDNQTYTHKAALLTQDATSSVFKLDDGTQTIISTDGQGDAQVVYGDFNLEIGDNVQNLRPSQSPNPRTDEVFFPALEQFALTGR